MKNSLWRNPALNLYNNSSNFQKNKKFVYAMIGTIICVFILGLGLTAFVYHFKNKKKKDNKKTNWLLIAIPCILISILILVLIWYNYYNLKSSPFSHEMSPAQNIYSTFVSSKRQI